ncbi:hypothetical protein B7463_g727, partial [Scytalidium lignicola]
MRFLSISLIVALLTSAVVGAPSEKPSDGGDKAKEEKAASTTESSGDADGTTTFNAVKVPPIPEIPGDTFNEAIKDGYWFVKHYSPYCPHCTHIAPTWQTLYEYYYTSKSVPTEKSVDSASTSLNSFTPFYNFHFGSLNCAAFGTACEKNGVKSWPTFILYKDGTEMKRFDGIKTLEGLSEFIEQNLEVIRPGSRPVSGPKLPVVGATTSPEFDDSEKKSDPASQEKKEKSDEKETKGKDTKEESKETKEDAKDKKTNPLKATPSKQKPGKVPNALGQSISLTAESFQSLVTMTQEPWFIKFYAPWCGHCQALAPNWIQLGKERKGRLNIGEVNCDVEKRLCKDVRVRGYPTILFFRGGERVEYEGLRGLGDLVSYTEKAIDIGSGVIDVDAVQFQEMEKYEDVIFLYFYDHATTNEDFMALERLTLSLIGHAKLVKTNSATLVDRFKITTWPRLLVSRDGRPTYYTALAPQDMRDAHKVLHWMQSVWLPIVPELTASNAREIMDGKLVVLGVLTHDRPDEFAQAQKEFKSAALEWMDKETQMFQLERQELRDAKQLRLEEAEDRNDQRALRAAKSIRINMDRSDRRQVAFAWVDGVFWERWIRTTYGIEVKDGDRVIINDEDNRQYWDTTITGNHIIPSRTSILETIPKVVISPPKIKPKSTISRFEKFFFNLRGGISRHPWVSIGVIIGVVFGASAWFRGRLRRSRGGFFKLDEKDGLLGGNTNGKKLRKRYEDVLVYTMLPSFLESTYKQYKNDTTIFIKWLSDSAQRCGCVINSKVKQPSSVGNVPPAGPRLKGKARKLAKEKEKAQSKNPLASSSSPSTYQFGFEELRRLATTIANSKDPLISVPAEIMRAGLRAIYSRKKCAEYYARNDASPEDPAARKRNAGHLSFISLMEEITKIIQPLCASSGGVKEDLADFDISSASINELENRFAVLDVEIPAEDLSKKPEAPPVPQESVYEVEIPKTDEDIKVEKMFAFFCLFEDLQRLRKFLEKVWTEYKDNCTSAGLITAAITTNTAFQLARRTQEEFLASYPEYADFSEVVYFISGVFGDRGEEEEIEVDGSMAEWVFAPAHSLLDSFCDVLKPGMVPVMKRGHFGVYNPLVDRSKISDLDKQHEDLILLTEVLPEFCFLQKLKVPPRIVDELTKGIMKMVETKSIPIWLAFATTVFLDIHHLLRQNVDTAFQQLQTLGIDAKKTVDRYFDFSQDITPPSTWPRSNEQFFRQMIKDMEDTILTDVIFPVKAVNFKSHRLAPPDESEKFYLYKRQPILCGILAFQTVLNMLEAGIAWGTVIYVAQFYNALRQKTDPIQPWPLMDEVISIHTEEKIFIGTAPKNVKDSFKQACLLLGVSPTQFARNRRENILAVSRNGPRGLEPASVLGDLFQSNFQMDRTEKTLHDIEELLNLQAQNATLGTRPKAKQLHRLWAASHRLTPLQLLDALHESIPIELKKLRFNYFHMHEQSIRLLRAVRLAADADLKKYIGPQYIENESQLPFVGLSVLMVAGRSTQAAEHMGIPSEIVGSQLLENVGQVVEDFIRDS